MIHSDSLPLVKCEDLIWGTKSSKDMLENANIYSLKITYENPELANYILQNHTESVFDEHGYTPLMTCVKFDCINTIRKLLEEGVDPNLHKEGKVTPLLLAVYKYIHDPNNMNKQIVRVLLYHKADPHIKTSSGENPYDLLKDADSLHLFGLA